MISFFESPSLVRRSTYARVAGWPGREPIRVITIRHSAWLASRFPPRLSRCLLVFPEEAGIGATPHRCAHELSLRSRSGWSPAATSSSAAVSGPTPNRLSRPGARAVTSGPISSSRRSSWASRNWTRRPSSRSATRVAYPGTAPGRGRSAAIASISCAGERRTNRARSSSGPVMISARAWLIAWARSWRALRLATISARIASTAPSRPRGAPRRPPRPGSPRRAGRIQRVRLALPRPVLPVWAVHLHHPHPGCRQIAGQARPVAAGALHAGHGESPEPAQPAQQAGVAGGGGGELLHAQQPADRIQRGRDMQVSVRVHAAGDGARVLYDGVIAVPFMVEGWHAPAGRRTREPRPLAQAGQIRPAPPAGATTGTRPASQRKDNLNGVGRIGGQAGSQAPTLRPNHRETTEARHVSELL